MISFCIPHPYLGTSQGFDNNKASLSWETSTWWGRGDSNPHGFLHVILNHARLPIPTLPQYDPPRTRTWNLLIKSQLLCQIELAGHTQYQLYVESPPLSTVSPWGRPLTLAVGTPTIGTKWT